MDGVIVDSNPVHRKAWIEYTREHGVETTDEMIERMYGRRNDDIVRDFLGAQLTDQEVFEHGAAKERLYREMMPPLLPGALVPGVREFLERHQDLPTGCASNAEPANIDLVLQAAKLEKLFRVSVNGMQVDRPKPYPDIYLKTAELLGVKAADCLVFEDSHAGVRAGIDAGMTVVGLLTTHPEFDGVALAIDNFLSPELEPFLTAFLKQ